MRCYFHLVSRHDVIADETGIDVTDLEAAEAHARQAIEEFRQAGDEAEEGWEGWQISVTDASGCVLLSIPLMAVLH